MKGKTSVALGLAYHAFLERFDFAGLYEKNGGKVATETLRERIERTILQLSDEDGQAARLLSVEKLQELLDNPVFYELCDMRLYKEQQFLVSLPIEKIYGKSNNTVEDWNELRGEARHEEMLFQGAIDLLAVGENQVRIIDYKYSRRSATKLYEHYSPQLQLYRLAVAKILKIEPEKVRCTIVNIYHGFQVDME